MKFYLQIAFKSSHVGSCTKFRVVTGTGGTECMKIKDPHDGHYGNDTAANKVSNRAYGNALSKDLDPNGYK